MVTYKAGFAVATLDGEDLPPQFSYQPYIPVKRVTKVATANAVVVQTAEPTQIVHGDSTIPWSIEGAYPTEFQTLFTLYNTDSPTLYNFVGYWGETLEVTFDVLDPPAVRGRLFSLSGQFGVVSVVTNYTGVDCTTGEKP